MEDETKVPRFTGYAMLNSENREHRGLHGESLMYLNREIAESKFEESRGHNLVRVDVYENYTAKITDVTPKHSQ